MLILGGWNSALQWICAFASPRRKNAFALESSVSESTVKGWRGLLKRIFLSRISKVFASGKMQKKLLDALEYCGEVAITKGVGVYNIVDAHHSSRSQKYAISYTSEGLFIAKTSKTLWRRSKNSPTARSQWLGMASLKPSCVQYPRKTSNSPVGSKTRACPIITGKTTYLSCRLLVNPGGLW